MRQTLADEDMSLESLLAYFNRCARSSAWSIVQAYGDRTDAFGRPIREGEYRLVRKGFCNYERELSLSSARLIWDLIVADNGSAEIVLKHLKEIKDAEDKAYVEAVNRWAAELEQRTSGETRDE